MTQLEEEIRFWMKIVLAKNEDGNYINGPEQEEAVKMINLLRGVSETIDLKECEDFEIIKPKQLTQ